MLPDAKQIEATHVPRYTKYNETGCVNGSGMFNFDKTGGLLSASGPLEVVIWRPYQFRFEPSASGLPVVNSFKERFVCRRVEMPISPRVVALV